MIIITHSWQKSQEKEYPKGWEEGTDLKAYTKLPESHKGKQIARIELERSKVLSRLIKTVQAVLAVLLLAIGCLFLAPSELTNMKDPFEHLTALMLGMISVSIVQELTRGFLMRIISGVKPTLRFSGAYLHAGCEAYFPRREEQLLNLSPLLFFTVVLLIIFFSVPDVSWKWMVWIVFTVNICFGVGYGYASMRFAQMPADILVMNLGPTYLVYSAHTDEN